MASVNVNGHSSAVWNWSGDPLVPRSNPLLVRKFLLLSLLIWKGGFEILPNDTWDLLKKAYGTSKKLRFQFRGQLNKPFSEPTYLYTNLTLNKPYVNDYVLRRIKNIHFWSILKGARYLHCCAKPYWGFSQEWWRLHQIFSLFFIVNW